MNPISEYKTVYGNCPEAIDRDVNGFIHEGWQPYGNLIIKPAVMLKDWKGSTTYHERWVQVMVKY